MKSTAPTVAAYLAALPPDRREAIEAVRNAVLKNLGPDFEEGIQYGMIGYYVPHSVFPPGYHCDPKQPLPYASIASQKSHMAIYLMSVYGSPQMEAWFKQAWAKSGKKLDMGKSCVRFKKVQDVALDVIAEAIRRVPAKKYIAHYQATLGASAAKKGAPKKSAVKKTEAKKRAAKRSAVTR